MGTGRPSCGWDSGGYC